MVADHELRREFVLAKCLLLTAPTCLYIRFFCDRFRAGVRILPGNRKIYSIFQRNTNTALNEAPLTRPLLLHTYSKLQLPVINPSMQMLPHWLSSGVLLLHNLRTVPPNPVKIKTSPRSKLAPKPKAHCQNVHSQAAGHLVKYSGLASCLHAPINAGPASWTLLVHLSCSMRRRRRPGVLYLAGTRLSISSATGSRKKERVFNAVGLLECCYRISYMVGIARGWVGRIRLNSRGRKRGRCEQSVPWHRRTWRP